MKNYETILGLSFLSSQGVRVRSFQLVKLSDRMTHAILDLDDKEIKRFMFTEEVSSLVEDWKKQVIAYLA